MNITSVSAASTGIQTAVSTKTDMVNMQVSLDVLKSKFEADMKMVKEILKSGESFTQNNGSTDTPKQKSSHVDRFA